MITWQHAILLSTVRRQEPSGLNTFQLKSTDKDTRRNKLLSEDASQTLKDIRKEAQRPARKSPVFYALSDLNLLKH
jgi:hypothetical protein